MCRRPLEPRPILALAILVGLFQGSTHAQGSEPIHLDGWSGKARYSQNPGPGQDVFRLVAEASWGSNTPREPGRYAVQVQLPDGTTTTNPLTPRESLGASRIDVLIPAASIRGLRPEQVRVNALIVDQRSGATASNPLTAEIKNFPSPPSGNPPADPGPFGWGEPLSSEQAALLSRPGPDGLTFVRLPIGTEGTSSDTAVFLSTTEVSNQQVAARLEGYAPPAGRSDEFPLEGGEQPAFGLSPAQAEAYCEALRDADSTGVAYRIPTRDEWFTAALANSDGAFWWGDEPTHPDGANFLGPEPALMIDATAPTRPGTASPRFASNPWGLFHTFGNVAEWATVDGPGARSYVRLGGHFRTEPGMPLPEPAAPNNEEPGDDLFVGVRPSFNLTASEAIESIQSVLSTDGRLADADIHVEFNPARVAAILTGTVEESTDRRRADELLRGVWWLAAVENQLATPTIEPGRLVELGQPLGPARRSRILDVILESLPIEVRWADELPVEGSSWWVNIYTTTGGHLAYKLEPHEVGRDRTLVIHLDRRGIRGLGAGPGDPISLGLSLDAPAPSSDDPNIVSNLARLPMPGGS